jgi:hypothetical protein
MARDTVRPKTAKRTKSSRAARALIKAAIQRYGSQRRAARALGLPNQSQLRKILLGLMKDTPAMRAAIARAKERARRAYYFVPPPPKNGAEPQVDIVRLRLLNKELNDILSELP